MQREDQYMMAQRSAKEALRREAAAVASYGASHDSAGLLASYRTGTWNAYNTGYGGSGLTTADKSALDVTNLVPVRKTTTWSLGTF